MRSAAAPSSAWTCGPRIGAITAPTLIVAGADDPATPVALMQEIGSRIPDAELLVLPRAAHLLAVERADLVSLHLSAFLDRAARMQQALPGGRTFEAGLANRRSVLGAAHVARSLDRAGAFAMPWQDFITRVAWGEIWGDPALPWKTRSLITLAMMVALHREEEFKLHVRPALRNGVTLDELARPAAPDGGLRRRPGRQRGVPLGKDVLGDEPDIA
jgi:3-oxoadipate enol-lactonase/4-carboxymuconolactone decarboxylase